MATKNTAPVITVAEIEVTDAFTRGRTTMYVAHGPDGHAWMLKRLTKDAALRDGTNYFLATRKLDASGRWVLS